MSAPPERFAAALASRYRLERVIGEGGMATVWLARDLRHDREVALKVLRPELTAILGAERFLNEIRITARLDHPHILTLIDSGADEGLLWYVVPFIRGESLRQRIERELQLGIEDSVGIARQVASALEYAHRQGVIHRDIKPENILLHEGEAVLADFGIALALRQAGGNRLTETGLSLGTPQYMSPEQATGDRQLDARSDVYSLGAVLYEMLTGEPPHTGATVQAVIAKLMTERPTPVRTVRDTVPPALDAAVMRALAKVPADRFASAGDFSRTLEGATKPAIQPSSHPAIEESGRLPKWAFPAALIAVALVVGAVAWLAVRRAAERPSRPLAEPTRTQFTFTGDVSGPAISPDGQRLALIRELCDSAGICSRSLVVQDVRGAGAQTLLQGWAGIYSIRWSRDGRWLLVLGTDPASRFGTFILPSLGGQHRFVGPMAEFLDSPDTLLVLPEPDRSSETTWWRVVTTADGVIRDSIAVRLDGFSIPNIAVAPGGRLIVGGATRSGASEEVLLIDRTGAIRDRWSPKGMTIFSGLWEAEDRAVVAVQERRPGAPRYLMRVRIDPRNARILGEPVRLARLGEGDEGPISLSADGRVIALVATTARRRILTLSMDPRTHLPRVAREVAAFTGDAFAQVAPSGRSIAVRVPTAGDPARSPITIQPFAGGPEEVLVAPDDSIANWEWAPDRDVLYYTTPGSGGLTINEMDATTRRGRTVGSIPGARVGALTDFEPLQGGGFAWLRQRDPLVYYQLPGDTIRQLDVPNTSITFTNSAPGGFGLALAGYSLPGGDTLRIFVANLRTREVRQVWSGVMENVAVAWMPDGTIYGTLTERQGTRAGWTIYTDGRPAVRHGLVPFARATYRITADGTRGSAAVTDLRTDAWLLTDWDPEAGPR